jgi:hypothetical protein
MLRVSGVLNSSEDFPEEREFAKNLLQEADFVGKFYDMKQEELFKRFSELEDRVGDLVRAARGLDGACTTLTAISDLFENGPATTQCIFTRRG